MKHINELKKLTKHNTLYNTCYIISNINVGTQCSIGSLTSFVIGRMSSVFEVRMRTTRT